MTWSTITLHENTLCYYTGNTEGCNGLLFHFAQTVILLVGPYMMLYNITNPGVLDIIERDRTPDSRSREPGFETRTPGQGSLGLKPHPAPFRMLGKFTTVA